MTTLEQYVNLLETEKILTESNLTNTASYREIIDCMYKLSEKLTTEEYVQLALIIEEHKNAN